jgi:hypothetical protein
MSATDHRKLAIWLGSIVALTVEGALAQDLVASRARWAEAGISDYEYSYQRVCECHPEQPADTIVTVRDGKVAAVRYARKDYVEDISLASDRLGWFRTIDDLFTLLDTATAREAEIRVSFDPRYGYPAAVHIDYVADLVGDEVDLRVTRFEPAR